jgi:hypothetical protein
MIALVLAASLGAAVAQPAQTCFDMTIDMMEPQGTPVQVIVRSKKGVHLAVATLKAKQQLLPIHLCWPSDDEPWQIEATFDLGGHQFVGTVLSMTNVSNTYCILLPRVVTSECGEWGTGRDFGEGHH